MLNLAEELLILAYYEEKALPLSTSLSFSLVGAVLAELLIRRKIKRHGPNLRSADFSPCADPILDDALAAMASSRGEFAAKYWVHRLHSAIRRLRPRLAEQLAAKGILTRIDHRSLGLFPVTSFRLADPHSALALKDQLRQVLFQPFAPKPRQMALLGLVQPVGLKLFTREERRAVKARIGEILRRDEISKAVSAAIADAEGVAAAIVAASAGVGA